MRKIHRQILSWIAVGVFVIVAPVLVLYSMGYRYDFKKLEFTKVGMLVIESQPESVDVFFNNKFVDNGAPFKVSSLTPGNYKIRVEKQGFFTWKKTLKVLSSKVNWASHVRLFYEKPELKEQALDSNFDSFSYSADDQKIYLLSNEEENKGIFEFDLNNSKLTKIFPKNDDNKKYQNSVFTDLKVSLHGNYVFFSWQNSSTKNYVIANSEKIINLNSIFDAEIFNPSWSKQNDSLIYWIYKNNLYSFSADSENIPSVVLASVLNFTLGEDFVFFAKSENGKFVLKKAKENNFSNEDFMVESLENLDFSEIKAGIKNAVAFKLKNDSLYLVKQKKNSNDYVAAKIFDDVKDFVWSKEENKLLYYNDNEMWFYELINKASDIPLIHAEYKVNNANLIIRIGSKIDKAIWYSDFEHVLYLSNNKVNAIELDERSTKNSCTFNNFEVNDFAIDKKGENMIFLNPENKLFEARISEDDSLF